MKTFETEKRNVPEGATHMCDGAFVKMNDESKDSGWCKVLLEGKWHRVGYLSNCVKTEGQTSIETPEEKGVEWVNGDECFHNERKYTFIGMTPTLNSESCIIFDPKNGVMHVCIRNLSKPETPQQREEREKLEAAYELYAFHQEVTGRLIPSFGNFEIDEVLRDTWLAIVDKTNYRVGGE